MGLCLLDWSAWRRLPKMSRVDAAAFLVTAVAVLAVNAVLAVAIGCSLYVESYTSGCGGSAGIGSVRTWQVRNGYPR